MGQHALTHDPSTHCLLWFEDVSLIELPTDLPKCIALNYFYSSAQLRLCGVKLS